MKVISKKKKSGSYSFSAREATNTLTKSWRSKRPTSLETAQTWTLSQYLSLKSKGDEQPYPFRAHSSNCVGWHP